MNPIMLKPRISTKSWNQTQATAGSSESKADRYWSYAANVSSKNCTISCHGNGVMVAAATALLASLAPGLTMIGAGPVCGVATSACGQRLHRRTGGRQTLRNHAQRHHPHSFLRRLTHPSPGFLLLSTVVNSYDYPGVDDDAADSSHPRACAIGHAPPPAAGPPATHQAPRRPHRLPDPPTAQRHSDGGPSNPPIIPASPTTPAPCASRPTWRLRPHLEPTSPGCWTHGCQTSTDRPAPDPLGPGSTGSASPDT